MAACGKGGDDGERVRSVYYWSTVLDIDSTKQDFIDRHGISRMYVRYFDVVIGEDGRPVPNATLRFRTGVPRGMEIVPTVYIVNDCMAAHRPCPTDAKTHNADERHERCRQGEGDTDRLRLDTAHTPALFQFPAHTAPLGGSRGHRGYCYDTPAPARRERASR